MLNFFRSLFYSKDTKQVNEIFSSKANIFNCNSDVEYDGNLFFNGTVNGNLTCKFLKIGSNSLVAGNINSDWVFVLGEVKGDIIANRVAIGPSAKVHGKISYNSISIEPGATILGNYFKRKSS
jgi:cytoskeletal protein CcmA (bactofilin family)